MTATDKTGQAALDRRFMAAALRLSRKNAGRTSTNPSVGTLIVRDDGAGPMIVGTGVTAVGGRPHAETEALAEAAHVVDKIGRANVISGGMLVVSLLCIFGIPNASSKASFSIMFVLLNVCEGVILVATPAVVRDFSPQVGRASAMGFWTMGPVLGSVVVTVVVASGSDTQTWQDKFVVSGIVGIVVGVITLFGLKELPPSIRDQVMVDARDRALVEAKMKGIDVEESLQHPIRQMLKPDILLSGLAISLFLVFYIVLVAFGPTYDWNQYFTVGAALKLDAGTNTVRIWAVQQYDWDGKTVGTVHTGDGGVGDQLRTNQAANLDQVTFAPAAR